MKVVHDIIYADGEFKFHLNEGISGTFREYNYINKSKCSNVS